jgi:rsbT antagonist protein RsbS
LDRIPILKLNGFLLATIQVELHDQLVVTLQDDLTQMLARTHAAGVLIDISALEIVDSFIGRSLAHIAGIASLMDAATVLVGMRPAVAITMLELGMTLKGVRTALNVEMGMKLLGEAVGEPGAAPSPA